MAGRGGGGGLGGGFGGVGSMFEHPIALGDDPSFVRGQNITMPGTDLIDGGHMRDPRVSPTQKFALAPSGGGARFRGGAGSGDSTAPTDTALVAAPTDARRIGIGALVGAVLGGLLGWFTPFVGLKTGALVGATIGGGAVFTGYASPYGDSRAAPGTIVGGGRTQDEIDRWVEAMRLRGSGVPTSSGGGTAPVAPDGTMLVPPPDDASALSPTAKLAIGVTGLAVIGGGLYLAWKKYGGARTNPKRRRIK